MSKIFIIQDMHQHDYSLAEKFGQLVFIGKEDINTRFPIMGTPQNRAVMTNILKVLMDFQGGDYLVISGNPLTFAVALQFLSMRGSDVLLLKWDNRSHQYAEILYSKNLINEILTNRSDSIDKETTYE